MLQGREDRTFLFAKTQSYNEFQKIQESLRYQTSNCDFQERSKIITKRIYDVSCDIVKADGGVKMSLSKPTQKYRYINTTFICTSQTP